MRFDDPELLDQLAREYVLGTLAGPARRRFAGLLAGNLRARRAVLDWERRLVPLATGLAPVAPPERVWTRLAAELGFAARPPAPSGQSRWGAIAAALAALAVGLGLWSTLRPPVIQVEVREVPRDIIREAAYTAVVADGDQPVWLLTTYPELAELRVTTVAAAPVAPEVYELWMLPSDGTNPVSLGLLPETGERVLKLDARRLNILAATATLAVSREPAGGSPIGTPTGPVLYTAPLLRTRT